jgi:hypothetical protein
MIKENHTKIIIENGIIKQEKLPYTLLLDQTSSTQNEIIYFDKILIK